jgi:hypothetical protein
METRNLGWTKLGSWLLAVALMATITVACGGGGSDEPEGERFAKSTRRVHSYNPGPDGEFGTSDDVVGNYNHIVFQANGDASREHWYNSSGYGEDEIWFTADDVPAGGFYQPGTDGGFGISGPGADGQWGTADDVISSREAFDVVANGNVRISAYYGAPGEDGQWNTEDDVQTRYFHRLLNENGGETRRVAYFGPGEDGEWYTADDVIGVDWFGAWVENTYLEGNDHSKWESWDRQVSYDEPGEDGLWLTADDEVRQCVTQVFGDGTQYWTRRATYLPGTDGACFTEDDVQIGASYAVNRY